MKTVRWERVREWNDTWALAVVFGLASVPWTYAFVAGLRIPLWPSFIASATFYAAGDGIDGLTAVVRRKPTPPGVWMKPTTVRLSTDW